LALTADILARLLRREPIGDPVLLLAAHPDDETVGAGALLHLLRDLLLLHATDGAPRDLADARRAAFSSAEEYASCRRRELNDALQAGGVHARTVALDIADQRTSFRMAELARHVADSIKRHHASVVLTHPYEGGHPDHDACAFAARFATLLAARHMTAPAILEMTSYHATPEGGWVSGVFLPNGEAPLTIDLTAEEQARKRAMLDCFRTQADILAPFGPARESFRPAPAYDFRAPPHAGTLNYERYNWGVDGPRWREMAAQAMLSLGLPP
jgi:LmbE family N-acetylglucosaminyl deacetylase